MLRNAPRLRRGALLIRGLAARVDPGSAAHHYVLRRVRETDKRALRRALCRANFSKNTEQIQHPQANSIRLRRSSSGGILRARSWREA